VEPPQGAASRNIGPFADGVVDPERSLHFWYYNTSKRSLRLDAGRPTGRALLGRLLAGADVLIHGLLPAQAAARRLDYASLRPANPRLVVCAVTPFGQDGPWADYRTSDLVALAAGGPLHTCGYDDLTIPPVLPGGNQSYHITASFAYNGILLALIQRQRTRAGEFVDVSMHESLAVTIEMAAPYWFYNRALVRRQTCRHAAPVLTQSALLQCGDGRYVYFVLIIAEQKAWQALMGWLDSKGLALDLNDAAYQDADYRRQHFAHIQGVVESFALLHDAETFFHEAQARGLPAGIIYAPEELLLDRHLRARQFFVSVEHDDLGSFEYPGAPYRFTHLRWAIHRRAPHIGEDTAAVLREQLGLNQVDISALEVASVI
jgi:crotonobetainyl-CoA:carnitine CoA-transferase CaiB-like acyl-CoA transferase